MMPMASRMKGKASWASAAIARGEPEGGADEAAHDHRGQPDHQRDARAEDHPREDVAAEVIGAEEMGMAVRALEGRGLEPDAERLPLGILHNPGRDDGEHGEEGDEAQAQAHEPGHAAAPGPGLLHCGQGELSRRGRGDRGSHRGGRR